MQLLPFLTHSVTLQCKKTSPSCPENWNVLKEKLLDVPCPLFFTFTVESAGLGQLVKQTEEQA